MDILKRVFTGEIKGIDDVEKTLTAYISTNARDRMDEVLEPEGMDKRNFDKNPVVMWAHDYTQPPIGKALWTKRDGEGVLSKVKFANTEFAQEIFQLYKEGFLKAFSVGFVPKEHEDGDGKKTARRTYKKWELLEYSAVPVPANPEALSLAIQKGILKNDELKKSFESSPDEEEKPKEEVVEEKNVDTFSEIYDEIKTLTERVSKLADENAMLRYKLYLTTQKKDEKSPGITADKFAQTVADVVGGVIRKHQGKLN